MARYDTLKNVANEFTHKVEEGAKTVAEMGMMAAARLHPQTEIKAKDVEDPEFAQARLQQRRGQSVSCAASEPPGRTARQAVKHAKDSAPH